MPVFIDYASLYYEAVARTEVPSRIAGKFVVITKGRSDFLVFSPKEFTKYHANIVEQFCLDQGLEGEYDNEGKRFAIMDHAWIVAGGGKYEIDRDQGTVKLYDDSQAYGKFDTTRLKGIIAALAEFAPFTVTVR